jgi:hypothetical protein
MPFNSKTGRSARARRAGLKRAVYSRQLDFLNLKLARAAKALIRAERKRLLRDLELAKRSAP